MTGPRRPDNVPDWLAASLNYCMRCSLPLTFGPLATEERERLACPACGWICYVNPRLVVSTLPITDDGGLVLLRRAIEPGYGAWAQPGGFLEIDETAEEGAIRETLEETGLHVELLSIVGIYSRPQAAVVVIAWEARVAGGRPHPTAESLEVRTFRPDDIPWPQLAFQTTAWALRDWVRRSGRLTGAPGRGGGPRSWPDDSA